MLTKDQTQSMIRREYDWKLWIFTEDQKLNYQNGILPEMPVIKIENVDISNASTKNDSLDLQQANTAEVTETAEAEKIDTSISHQ